MTSRAAPDDEVTEVVRRRLEALLAQVPPRRLAVVAAPAPPEVSDGSDDPDEVPDDDSEVEAPASAPEVGSNGRRLVERAWSFTREHLVVVGIIVLTGCLWAGWSLLQARSSPVAVAVQAPPTIATPSATPSAPPLLVHVLGAVRRPGVVRLASGARVQDAIRAAGGLAGNAAPGQLNLAAPVVDGAQLVIGRRGSPGGEMRTGTPGEGPGSQGGKGAAVDLNTATLAQLDTLPGVGPVTAQKILDRRQAVGRFRSVAELQEVDGIGPKTYAQIAPHVRV